MEPTEEGKRRYPPDGYYTVMDGKYLNGAAQLPDHTPPGWDHVTMLNDWSANNSSECDVTRHRHG